jgi:uncharacterized protein GlcG (DUF336 family)
MRPRFRLFGHPAFKAAMAVLSVLCAAPSDCGGGGGGLSENNYSVPDQTTEALSADQVTTILRQAANEATLRGAPATIAVVDRLGNVLAVAQMPGAPANATITSGTGVTVGLETVAVPNTLAAISKAITGAFLSSGGNAFSTRTANEIIQQHFPLGISGNPAGPLFGVQFSQLPCSDFGRGLSGGAPSAGPQHSPLGLAADPGGMPLYISGVLVGGIGVASTASYSLNPSLYDQDNNDEGIALAGSAGFSAPVQIQAQNVAINGVNLDYVGPSTVHQPGVAAGATPPLVNVPGFFTAATPQAGLTYGTVAAGIFPDSLLGGAASYPPDLNAYVFGTGGAANRFPPTAGTTPADGNAITATEATELVTSALTVAEAARAGIRIPSSTHAQVTVSVVDLDGNVLAMARTPDAPVFGADVSLQKARSAVFFSRADAGSAYTEINNLTAAAPSSPTGSFAYYIKAMSVNAPNLFNSGTAFSEVSIGQLARPFLPDGIDYEGPGPLSLPTGSWSVFSTGLQVDLVKADIAAILGGGGAPVSGCGGTVGLPANSHGITQIANGLQIFSGGYPIYRPLGNNNYELVGGLGVSGDGIQQDALVAYLGIQGDASVGALGAGDLINAPSTIRADNPARISLTPAVGSQPFTPLYVTCPPAPFLNSREQTPCN